MQTSVTLFHFDILCTFRHKAPFICNWCDWDFVHSYISTQSHWLLDKLTLWSYTYFVCTHLHTMSFYIRDSNTFNSLLVPENLKKDDDHWSFDNHIWIMFHPTDWSASSKHNAHVSSVCVFFFFSSPATVIAEQYTLSSEWEKRMKLDLLWQDNNLSIVSILKSLVFPLSPSSCSLSCTHSLSTSEDCCARAPSLSPRCILSQRCDDLLSFVGYQGLIMSLLPALSATFLLPKLCRSESWDWGLDGSEC